MDVKLHAKYTMGVRREPSCIRCYVHYVTSNNHPFTAKIYTDLSFFTCDPALCRDAARIFNYMTGYARPETLERVAVAPLTLKSTLLRLIDEEIDHAKAGRAAAIWVKLNALVDAGVIEAL